MTTPPTPLSAASHTPGPKELFVFLQADGQTSIAYKYDYGDGPNNLATIGVMSPRAGCADIDVEIVHRYNAFPALLAALREWVHNPPPCMKQRSRAAYMPGCCDCFACGRLDRSTAALALAEYRKD